MKSLPGTLFFLSSLFVLGCDSSDPSRIVGLDDPCERAELPDAYHSNPHGHGGGLWWYRTQVSGGTCTYYYEYNTCGYQKVDTFCYYN